MCFSSHGIWPANTHPCHSIIRFERNRTEHIVTSISRLLFRGAGAIRRAPSPRCIHTHRHIAFFYSKCNRTIYSAAIYIVHQLLRSPEVFANRSGLLRRDMFKQDVLLTITCLSYARAPTMIEAGRRVDDSSLVDSQRWLAACGRILQRCLSRPDGISSIINEETVMIRRKSNLSIPAGWTRADVIRAADTVECVSRAHTHTPRGFVCLVSMTSSSKGARYT